jgi:hypothetical protein
MPTKGFPELQQIYKTLEAADNIQLHALIHFKHNYNYVNRANMYRWVNKHLKLGLTEPIVEAAYQRLTQDELSVWDAEHPQPAGGADFERELLRYWTRDTRQQLDALKPTDADSLTDYREIVGAGIATVIGRDLPDAEEVQLVHSQRKEFDGGTIISGLLQNTTHHEELPVVLISPAQANGSMAIWLSKQGKSGLFDDAGRPAPEVKQLLRAGVAVIGADLFYQGEFLADGKPLERTGRVANTREAAAYTFGYNHTVFAQRVHDVLTVIRFARTRIPDAGEVLLLGLDGSGHWAAAARAQAGDVVDRAALDTGGFRFGSVDDIHSPDFTPGGAKYDDLPGMLAVAAPAPLWLAGESAESVPPAIAAYQAAGAAAVLKFHQGEAEVTTSACSWLLAE